VVRLVGVGRVDEVSILPGRYLHFLQPLAHDFDLGNDILDLADAVVEVAQV
jgi:hypothetical protein